MLFLFGVVAGAGALAAGVVVGSEHGLWRGAATGAAVVVGAALIAARPVCRGLRVEVAEAISLFLWAEKRIVWHFDPSARDGTWRGPALSLVSAYRREWAFGEVVALLRQLRASGIGQGRNPETGRRSPASRSRKAAAE